MDATLYKVIIAIIIIIIIRIAQSLYKTQHDKMFRPVYHFPLGKYGFDESDYSSPWYMQSHPQPS